jgi:hypothetical protein
VQHGSTALREMRFRRRGASEKRKSDLVLPEMGRQNVLQQTPDCDFVWYCVPCRASSAITCSPAFWLSPVRGDRWQTEFLSALSANQSLNIPRPTIAGMARLRLPAKPSFASTGNECVCPNCRYSATYFRNNLLYRA